ncbi:MAG: flagellar protein FliT [Pseudomonadales bacterium]|nr:flagellar protein FliT [Pseudomonadales bacterium]
MSMKRLMPARADRWVEILVLSHDMLDAASAERWDRLSELEVERWKHLSVVFSPAPGEDEAREVASCISELLSLDGMILERLGRARQETSAELLTLRRGREASSAYGEGAALA